MKPLLIAAAAAAEPGIAVVALTGIALVTLVLVVLILIIQVQGKIFDKIDSNKRKKAEAEKAASLASKQDAKPAAMPAAPAKVPPMVEDGIPEEVVAVIAAAVAAMGDGKYTLRSLTRVNPSRGKWGAAGAVFGTDPF